MAADIRMARANDVDALTAIENAVFDADRISKKSFKQLMASKSAAVLAATSGSMVRGYAVVLFRAGSQKARLYSVAAMPGSGPPGLGRALLGAAEDEAARRGATALRLEVRQDNARAIDLYEKNAYRGIGRIAAYYADGMAALRYEKSLGPSNRGAARAASGTASS